MGTEMGRFGEIAESRSRNSANTHWLSQMGPPTSHHSLTTSPESMDEPCNEDVQLYIYESGELNAINFVTGTMEFILTAALHAHKMQQQN